VYHAPPMADGTKTKRVLILGGGFGGVYTAVHLERLLRAERNIEVTLVSRDNYLLLTPLLFEAGSGVLEPRHAVSPLRPLFKRVRFVEGEVKSIDFAQRVVRAQASLERVYDLPYDQLVLALGGVTNRGIIPGSEHAMAFKVLADGIFLRNRTIDLFERADVEQDPEQKKKLLTFVVVGAGLVGVELMGELTEFTANLCRSYPRVSVEDLHFELIEAGPKVMPEMDRDLADYAVEVLRKRGVNVRSSAPVKQIEPSKVHLPDGSVIEAETVVLAAGVAANPLLKEMPVEKDRKGRIAVDGTMRSKSHPEVWAIGDCASIPDPEGKPYPQLAQHALREAKVLAGNIAATLHGQPLKPFVYKTLGTLAALGHYTGVGRVMKLKLRGFPAWWVWRTYYLLQMPRWERRLRIMLDWTIALFFKNDVVKLALFGEEHPLEKYEEEHAGKPREERIGDRG
jgi:NADH dehydrogenase